MEIGDDGFNDRTMNGNQGRCGWDERCSVWRRTGRELGAGFQGGMLQPVRSAWRKCTEELRGCLCVCVRAVRAALASSTGAQEDIWHDCKRRSDREMKAAEVTFRGVSTLFVGSHPNVVVASISSVAIMETWQVSRDSFFNSFFSFSFSFFCRWRQSFNFQSDFFRGIIYFRRHSMNNHKSPSHALTRDRKEVISWKSSSEPAGNSVLLQAGYVFRYFKFG